MTKHFITLIVTLLFSHPLYAATESVSILVTKLCQEPGSAQTDPDTASSKEAVKIFAMMKESEKRTCGMRGDDYINYLIEKYRARLNG